MYKNWNNFFFFFLILLLLGELSDKIICHIFDIQIDIQSPGKGFLCHFNISKTLETFKIFLLFLF